MRLTTFLAASLMAIGIAPTAALGAAYRFEENQGQFDTRIQFLARGSDHGLFLTSGGATLTLRRPNRSPAVLSMRIAGGLMASPEGWGQLEARSNYFVGSDPSRWRTGVPNYRGVRYRNVRSGVDLNFYGTGEHQAEYDIVIAPHVDPTSVVLVFGGIDGIDIEADGSALLRLSGGGVVRKPVPVAYQVGSQGVRTAVAARYQRRGARQIGFVLGRHDRGRAVTIDPVFAYSTLLGGLGSDSGNAIAVDATGNAYVAGFTTSADFPTLNPVQASNRNVAAGNAFVAKLSSSGGPSLIYATYLGGSAPAADDRAVGIAVDASGNAYVTGGTAAADFPTTAGAWQTTFHGVQDAFVSKLNPTGSALLYSTFLGGQQEDFGCAIAADSSGNVYLTGQTHSADFPTAAAFQAVKRSTIDSAGVFVTKLSPSGAGLVYSTFLGGTFDEFCGGIAIDASQNAYVSGSTFSTDFPLRAPIQSVFGGAADGFVTKFNAAGSALTYSTYLGGSNSDFNNGIAVDPAGNAYVTGTTSSTNYPTRSPLQTSNRTPGFTAFVSKINAAGSALTYSTYLGGTVDDSGTAIATDTSGNAYVTGFTTSPDFRVVSPLQPYSAFTDTFVSVFNPAGSALLYSTHLGGAGDDFATAIAADSSGAAYVTGRSASWNYPTPATALQPFIHGESDAFVTLAVLAAV